MYDRNHGPTPLQPHNIYQKPSIEFFLTLSFTKILLSFHSAPVFLFPSLCASSSLSILHSAFSLLSTVILLLKHYYSKHTLDQPNNQLYHETLQSHMTHLNSRQPYLQIPTAVSRHVGLTDDVKLNLEAQTSTQFLMNCAVSLGFSTFIHVHNPHNSNTVFPAS